MNNETSDTTKQDPISEANPKDELRQVKIVRAGSTEFGIFADEIATVVPWREPAPLPNAPASVLGVVSIQGRMLTVLALAILTAGQTRSRDASANTFQHIVALRGDEQLALAVEAVGDSVRIATSELKPRADSPDALVLGRVRLEGSEINILNLRDLFPVAIQGRERRNRRF